MTKMITQFIIVSYYKMHKILFFLMISCIEDKPTWPLAVPPLAERTAITHL